MMLEYVSIRASGYDWSGWTRISVQYGAEDSIRHLAATATDLADLSAADHLMPDTPITVTCNGQLLLTGYIEVMTPSYDAENHTIELTGKSKAVDATKASHEHKTHEFKSKTLLQIANELDAQGLGYSTDQQLQPMEWFRLEPGETVFAAIDRAARKQGFVLMSRPDGGVKITRAGQQTIHPALIEGINILGASSTFDKSNAHSKVTVKGQRVFGQQAKTSLRIKAESTGASTRNRPLVLVSEGDTDQSAAQKRADWHALREFGDSIIASVKCQGWRDSNGVLWEPNTLVTVISPKLKLSQSMLITQVDLTQDGSGSFTQLSLKHPAALGGKTSGKTTSGKGAQWTPPNKGML